MAKPAKAPDSFPLTVEEFCAGLSQTDKRVEMIGAFCAEERTAGRVRDDAVAYRKRYQAFCTRPVN